MGRGIIKIKDAYFEWSTVSDSPTTWGMTLDDFREYVKEEYGQNGIRRLDRRLQRVEEYGTSFLFEKNARQVIAYNRAGPNETELTENEIYRAYFLREPIEAGWLPS